MAIFPKIQSPCPYIADLASIMDGDHCRMCERQVFDLTAWSDEARIAFLSGCRTEVCVSYRIGVKPALAAAALAASLAGLPAAAQDAPAPASDQVAVEDEEVFIVVGGGIRPGTVDYVTEESADEALPALPVIHEEAKRDEAPAEQGER